MRCRYGAIFVLVCCVLTPCAKLPADAPATSPSQDSAASDLYSAANNDLQSGKCDQALTEFRAAADQFTKSEGNALNEDVALCLNGQALCLSRLRRDADALPIYQQTLKICQTIYKEQDNVDVACVTGEIATCLMSLNRDDEALPLCQAALEMRKRLSSGGDDADVATSLVSLGDCLADLDRQSDALPIYSAALDMRKRLCKGQDDPDVATTANSVGYCLFSLGRYDEALAVMSDVLKMRQRLYPNQDQMDVVSSLNNVAKCLDALGRDAEALPVYQSSLAMTRRLCNDEDNTDLATVMDNVAACMESLGRGNEALPIFQASLEMRQRIAKGQDDSDVAGSLNDLATCLGFLGRNQEALEKCQAALDMLERIHKGQDSPEVATALANVAQCLDEVGRSAEALPDHEAALAMRRRLYNDQDHPDIADSLTNLGGCFSSLGRHDDALATYQQALEMDQRVYKDQDNPDVATALSNVAVELDSFERFADALPLHQQALDMSRRIFKDQDHPSVADYLGLLAGCQISLNDPGVALANSQAALEMQQRIYEGRDHPRIAWSLARVGLCLSQVGRKPEALKMDQAAIAMSERLNSPDAYQYTSQAGDLLMSMRRFADAAAEYDKSIETFEQARIAVGGDERDRMKFMDQHELNDFSGYLGMFAAELALDRPDKAAECLDRGRARSLMDILNRAKRQTGGDVLAAVEAKARKTRDSRLLQEAEDAAAALGAAEEQVRQLTSQINYARSLNTDEANAQIDQLQPKLGDACRRYAVEHRRAFNLASDTTLTKSVSAAEIQAFLKPHQHMLMYLISDHLATLIVIPPSGQLISATNLTDTEGNPSTVAAALVTPIVKYQQAIVRNGRSFTRGVRRVNDNATSRPSDHIAQDGYDLFRKLMPAEVWREIKDDDLVYIVPDAMMNGLPLETLIDQKPAQPDSKDNRYWLDDGPAICYGPSAAALLKLCEESAGHPAKTYAHEAVLLGDPVFQRDATDAGNATDAGASSAPAAAETRDASLGAYGPLSPLPGTQAEVTGIYQVITGHPYSGKPDDSVVVLLGEDATGPRLADAVAGTRYLHLATHGLAKSGADAIYSGIVLTQPRVASSSDTGMLTLQDLFDHWWGKLDGTELVVLSACDSQGIDQGGGNAVTDEGVFGLPWGFWYAGCPTLVASLWEVQDSSTAKLMQDFYRNLESPGRTSKLAAFTAARKQIRRDYPEPFFWAPFIYLGNPN